MFNYNWLLWEGCYSYSIMIEVHDTSHLYIKFSDLFCILTNMETPKQLEVLNMPSNLASLFSKCSR